MARAPHRGRQRRRCAPRLRRRCHPCPCTCSAHIRSPIPRRPGCPSPGTSPSPAPERPGVATTGRPACPAPATAAWRRRGIRQSLAPASGSTRTVALMPAASTSPSGTVAGSMRMRTGMRWARRPVERGSDVGQQVLRSGAGRIGDADSERRADVQPGLALALQRLAQRGQAAGNGRRRRGLGGGRGPCRAHGAVSVPASRRRLWACAADGRT